MEITMLDAFARNPLSGGWRYAFMLQPYTTPEELQGHREKICWNLLCYPDDLKVRAYVIWMRYELELISHPDEVSNFAMSSE